MGKKIIKCRTSCSVEKSLAAVDEAKELNEIARNNDLALIENFQFRFHKQLKFIQDQVASNKLGEVKLIRSSLVSTI